MTMQTKITVKVLRPMVFFSLLCTGGWVSAGSTAVAEQAASVSTVTGNACESVAGPPEGVFTTPAPGPTIALLETVRQNGKQQAAEAAFSLGVAAIERKDFAAAQALIFEAVQLQPSNPGYLQAAAGLAFLREEFAEAQAYQVKSLELARAALGEDDLRVALLMDDLGTIYLARHDYTQAERTWRESLSIREQVLGTAHPSIIPRLNELAGLTMHDGRFDETELLLKRALHILDTDPEAERMDVAIGLHNLADFYVDRQRSDEAEMLYRKALAIWKTVPAQQRLQTAADLNELGNAYLSQRRQAGAASQFALVIRLLEDDFGPDHRYVREAMESLDKMNSEQAKLSERREIDQRMFEELRSQFLRHNLIM